MSIPSQILFDTSFLESFPTSYLYDPNPSKNPTTGLTINSPSAFTQNYVLRQNKKPHALIPITNTPSSFSVSLINTSGNVANYSSLSSTEKQAVITQQLQPGFNACTADPSCWAVSLQNTFDPSIGGDFSGSYKFNYYQKPPALNTPSSNTDPVELVDCDFTNTWYTFIKNSPGAINPSGPSVCIPPAVKSTTTNTNAPVASVDCPPNMASKPVSTPNYYYCVALQKAPPTPSIWSQPTTWIAIAVLVILLCGGGYYFWKKRHNSASEIDYSKYIKKVKGGYYFLN